MKLIIRLIFIESLTKGFGSPILLSTVLKSDVDLLKKISKSTFIWLDFFCK